MKALILDDSRAMRAFLARILGELGYEVLHADDGLAGLECLAANEDTALALVDWNMPNMDGLEFVKRVRDSSALSGMKLMMVTTETEMEQVVRAIEAGADEYVMKPFTREILLEKLHLLNLAPL